MILPDNIEALKAQIAERDAIILVKDDVIKRNQELIAHLEKLIADHKLALYGAKSEKRDSEQNQLTLEDLETEISKTKAKNEALDPPEKPAPKKPRKPRQKRKPFPENLPRVEEVITPENTRCACGKNCQIIGEDVSERLDIIPATFRVIVTRRPKFACGSCKSSVLQAPAKPHLIEGGIPTEATIAQVIVSKFADHLPLYRQSQIYARQGVEIERSTLADWVGKAALELQPVYDALIKNLKQSTKLFMPSRSIATQSPAG